MTEEERAQLEVRLSHIHRRVQWIADEEARSAWVQGFAARGGLMPEKIKLLDETDSILDKLMAESKS